MLEILDSMPTVNINGVDLALYGTIDTGGVNPRIWCHRRIICPPIFVPEIDNWSKTTNFQRLICPGLMAHKWRVESVNGHLRTMPMAQYSNLEMEGAALWYGIRNRRPFVESPHDLAQEVFLAPADVPPARWSRYALLDLAGKLNYKVSRQQGAHRTEPIYFDLRPQDMGNVEPPAKTPRTPIDGFVVKHVVRVRGLGQVRAKPVRNHVQLYHVDHDHDYDDHDQK